MAIFEMEIGGKLYEVDAPDMQTAVAAIQGGQGGGQFSDSLGQNFRTAREGMSPPAPPETSLMSAITDLPREVYDTTAGALSATANFLNPFSADRRAKYESGQSGILDTGKGLAAALSVPAAPFVGAARSLLGHPLAAADEALQAGGAALYGQDRVPQPIGYEGAKGYVDQAMAALGSRTPATAAPAPRPPTPSIADLRAAAQAGYNSPDIRRLAVTSSSIERFGQNARAALVNDGLDDIVATNTHRLLDRISNPPAGSTVTGQSLDSLRKSLGTLARERNEGRPTPNAVAAMRVQEELDNYIPNLTAADVVSGDPAAASRMWDWARGNYSAAMKSENIDRKVVQAENRAAASNSGMNVANTVRQRLATVMNDPKQLAGYSANERELIERVVRGDVTGNTLRFAGNLLGGGGGLGAVTTAAVGGLATLPQGGIGALAPVVGVALKAISNRMTLAQTERLSEAVRSRAPLSNAMSTLGTRMQSYQQAPTPKTFAALSLAARNLSNNMKDVGIAMSPTDILKSLQAPATGRAEDDEQTAPRLPAQ